MKPALLIRSAKIEITDSLLKVTSNSFQSYGVQLLLSTRQDLGNGVVMTIAQVGMENRQVDGTAQRDGTLVINDLFQGQGTLWGAKWVGGRVTEAGAITVDVGIHLDYEQVMVPFWDWFMLWEQLQNLEATQIVAEY